MIGPRTPRPGPDPARLHRACAGVLIATLAIGAATLSGPLASRELPQPTLVDINLASWHELQLLPGVGPALARRIVADRDERGAFASVDDLQRVRGVGERTVRSLRPFAVARP